MGWYCDRKKFYHKRQLREMVWYGAGIIKLGDDDGMVTGGGI